MRPYPALAVFVAVTAAAAVAASLATVGAAGQYASLERPPWAPPAWLFGPAWTVLYLMIAVAGWLAWRATEWRSLETRSWAVQIVLNALWSPIFFAWGMRGLALAWIVVLDVVVAVLAWRFWRVDRLAGALMVPYLAWILFATALSAAVWWLNR